MKIHFDFVAEDHEAEAIFDCINQEICKNHENILRMIDATGDMKIGSWYKKRNEYLKELKKKMLNEMVADEDKK